MTRICRLSQSLTIKRIWGARDLGQPNKPLESTLGSLARLSDPLALIMREKPKLKPYRGPLSAAQIAAGMNAAARNAHRLLNDAKLLLEHERFPSAASLAILAIEEDGKIPLLRTLALSNTSEDRADSWKDYRSHKKKNVAWILPQLAEQGARKLDELRPLVDEGSDHPVILDQIKQIGFYTDCYSEDHWSVPGEVVDKSLAEHIVGIAEILVNARTSEYTEREIELWIEHIQPVWKKDMNRMKQAVRDWARAIDAEGLNPEGSDGMEEFLKSK